MKETKIEELMELISNEEELKHEVLRNLTNSIEPSTVMASMVDYINSVCITISGIAEIAKKSSQAVISMIKCNEENFPPAYNVNGTNLYIKQEVIDWLIQNNKIARGEDDIVKQEYLIGTEKIVVVTGGPGNAKSTISVSAASRDIVKHLKRIFTAGGNADTENLIKLHFKKSSENYVIFHYGDVCNDSIPIRISNDNVKRIKEELKKCKEKAKKLREDGNIHELQGTYVELVLQPNEILSKLMRDCNISILTFIDTPGIDAQHSGESVAVADIIVVVLGDRDDVATVSNKIKKNIVPKTGTCQYIYLYNNRFSLNPMEYGNWEDIYDEYLQYAKEDLTGYLDGLKQLKDELVIGTTLSACNPFESLICVPNFGLAPSKIDEFFFVKFCEKMKMSFENSLYFLELNKFDMNLNSDAYLGLMNDKLLMMVTSLKKVNAFYTLDSFKAEKHGRTKSNDNYRIEYSYSRAMSSLKSYFYDIFSSYKTNNVSEQEASIIRMAYLTINEGLMNKVHYGAGSHPWEDLNSPTQMICEEVLSQKIVQNLGKDYCTVLKENGIVSKSWNYVYVNCNSWNFAKLIISNQFNLPDFKAENIDDYIKVCHYLPSILVQSVLTYFKLGPSDWGKCNFNNVLGKIMNGISV